MPGGGPFTAPEAGGGDGSCAVASSCSGFLGGVFISGASKAQNKGGFGTPYVIGFIEFGEVVGSLGLFFWA